MGRYSSSMFNDYRINKDVKRLDALTSSKGGNMRACSKYNFILRIFLILRKYYQDSRQTPCKQKLDMVDPPPPLNCIT